MGIMEDSDRDCKKCGKQMIIGYDEKMWQYQQRDYHDNCEPKGYKKPTGRTYDLECAQCGKEFTHKQLRKTCSDKCHRERASEICKRNRDRFRFTYGNSTLK